MSDAELSAAENVKATWCQSDGERVHDVIMCAPQPHVCNHQCPWLHANHGSRVELFYDHEVPGIPMPEDQYDYAEWKRATIWNKDLQDGQYRYGSLCHVRIAGTELRADHSWQVVARQCTGALVMQQRELLRHVQHGASALSPSGAARVASGMLGRMVAEHEVRELELRELLAQAHPDLLDPQIGSEAVAPKLTQQEIQQWQSCLMPVARANGDQQLKDHC